jgi:hypothetical protein
VIEVKHCKRCGREIEWRKKWEAEWASVRYCSDACRKARVGKTDLALENAILHLLDERPHVATICPSEAARAAFPDDGRDRMESARMAARRLVAEGKIVITQRGAVVDPSHAKGAIRLRKSSP